uniref:Uncharacterized protein n=1 Tax=Oryza brachyantha TaxID=4533 RepID=J3MPH7_ORYBR
MAPIPSPASSGAPSPVPAVSSSRRPATCLPSRSFVLPASLPPAAEGLAVRRRRAQEVASSLSARSSPRGGGAGGTRSWCA